MIRYSLTLHNDWPTLRSRYTDFTVIALGGDRLPGEWIAVTATLLGLGFSLTRFTVPERGMEHAP